MKKAELNAMLEVLGEYSSALGYYYAKHDRERRDEVGEGVVAIKRALKSAGVNSDIINDCSGEAFSKGVKRAEAVQQNSEVQRYAVK